ITMNASNRIDVERPIEQLVVMPPRAELLKGRYVAAICRGCGGWTMMHGDPTSETAGEWMRSCYADGEQIVYWRNPTSLGPGCPEAERRPRDRTCVEASR
ncbi:MAG: hypothetical protein ACTHU0_20265, partial [Kofleriaceae bacterium]